MQNIETLQQSTPFSAIAFATSNSFEKYDWKTLQKLLGWQKKFILQRVFFLTETIGHQFSSQPGKKFVANSIRQWHEQLAKHDFSMFAVRRIFQELVEEEFLIREKFWITKAKEANSKFQFKTKNQKHHFWYAVNLEKLDKMLQYDANSSEESLQTNLIGLNGFRIPQTTSSNTPIVNLIHKSDNKSDNKSLRELNLNHNLSSFKKKNAETEVSEEKTERINLNGSKEKKIKKPKLCKQPLAANTPDLLLETHKESSLCLAIPIIELKVVDSKNTPNGDSREGAAKEMVRIWNEEVFCYSLAPIKAYLNQKNSKQLYKIFVECFSSDMEQWKDYATAVLSSKWLMGEKASRNNFKATFNWLLKQDVVEQVLNGEFGLNEREEVLAENKANKIAQIVELVEEKMVQQFSPEVEKEFHDYMRAKNFELDDDQWNLKIYSAYYCEWFEKEDFKSIHELFKLFVERKKLVPSSEDKKQFKFALDSFVSKLPQDQILPTLELVERKLKTAKFQKACNFDELAGLCLLDFGENKAKN